jgi:hypothetical protein
MLTRAREVAPLEGVAGARREMREARRRMHFGVRSASGTADEERIGVIFLGCAGQDRKAKGDSSLLSE